MQKTATALIIPSETLSNFPGLEEGLKKALSVFGKIKTFEDVEIHLLRGQGLAPGTYRTYLTAVKQLYQFTDGLSPLQISKGHIEKFHEYLAKHVSMKTACVRMAGLKNFFKGIEELVPLFQSPFRGMSDKLKKKLGQTGTSKLGKALYKKELNTFLNFIKRDESVKGLENFAMMRMLIATGLRAAELCGLSWQDLEEDPDEGIWYCIGIGKGSKPFRQEIALSGVVEAIHTYFRAHFHREPKSEEPLFFTMSSNHHDPPLRMNPVTLYNRVREMGEKVKAAGLIKREITWSPHLMRRTCGTLLDKLKMSPVSIQHFLRHANLATTAKHYICHTESAVGYLAGAVI